MISIFLNDNRWAFEPNGIHWATNDIHLLLCCHLDLGPEDAGVLTLSCTSKFYFYNVGQRFAEVHMKVFLCQVIPLLSSLAVS